MSSDKRTPHAEALAIANEFVALIRDECEEVTIAGSLRRMKKDVGDIEIVVLPKPDLFTCLDKMVTQGTMTKALYGNLHRWGQTYRGVMFKGMKLEIFTCDTNNRGYIQWLRTGPGDANTAVMTQLIKGKASWRFIEGHAYYGHNWRKDAKANWQADDMELIPVPDERTMFRVLGMDYVEPQDRTENRYMKAFATVTHRWGAKPHVCRIWTGRISTSDPDALDITIKSANTQEGKVLAPPNWEMVNGVKVGTLLPEDYEREYLAALRQRYASDPMPFLNILKHDRVVLTCYCPEDFKPCHRHLAVEVLTKIAKSRGILVQACGELQPEYRMEAMF